jgi:RecA-family ATPase
MGDGENIFGVLPERTKIYLANGAQKGNRNDELLNAACQFRDAGYSEHEAAAQLRPRALADGLSSAEAIDTIRSAFSRAPRKPIGPAKANPVANNSYRYRRISPQPAAIPKAIDQATIMFLEAVFRPGEFVAIAEAREIKKADGISVSPNGGSVRARETWIADIKQRGLEAIFQSNNGLFVRVNPMKNANGKTDNDVAVYRHVLVESDEGTQEQQLGAILKIGLPISAITFSGDRSVHALVVVDAPDHTTYRDRFEIVQQFCTQSLGLKVDGKNKNPSRFSRMPGARRARRNHDTNECELDSAGRPILDNQTLLKTNIAGKPWDEWLNQLPVDDGLPEIKSLIEIVKEDLPEPPQIITGILHQGLKLLLGAPSKARKTWILMHLALALATGNKWLGHQCEKGPVLYVNFELPEPFFRRRAQHIFRQMGVVEAPPDFYELNLRGYAGAAEILLPKIADKIKKLPQLSAIIIDPTYKLMGTKRDENAAVDIAGLMNEIDKLAVESGAAVVSAAHFAKGNASSKEAIDRISGSGVFGRDPDSILIMSPLNEEEAYCIEFYLRCLPPKEKIAVKWDTWCFIEDSSLDPSDLKRPGRTPKYSAEDLLDILGTQSLTDKDWAKQCLNKTTMSDSAFHRFKRQLAADERVHRSKLGTWSKTPKEAVT